MTALFKFVFVVFELDLYLMCLRLLCLRLQVSETTNGTRSRRSLQGLKKDDVMYVQKYDQAGEQGATSDEPSENRCVCVWCV